MPNTSALESGSHVPLFLLSPPILEKDFSRSLWGSLVTEPYTPTNHFSSFRKKAPTDMVPDIGVNPSRIKDYAEIMKWSRRGGVEAIVESFCKAMLKSGESELEFRESTFARWYFMTSPTQQLDTLLQNEQWANDALAFIEKNEGKEMFFVSAMFVVERMKTGKATGKDLKGAVGATALNPQDGTKLVSAVIEGEESTDRVVGGTILDPHILAIGCYPVRITREDQGKEKMALRAKLRKFFGLKPKHLTVGLLFPVDKSILYRLKVGERMVEGNLEFMEDNESEKDVENNTVAGASATQNLALSPVISGSAEEPLGEPSLDNVAIYSSKVPAQ